MNQFRKALALLLSLCLALGATAALAEASQDATQSTTGEVTQAVATTGVTLADTDVVANVNGTDITGAQVKEFYQSLVNYYGEPDATSLDLYYAVAMEQALTLALIHQTATDNGLAEFAQADLDSIYAESDTAWQSALDNYVQSNAALAADATQEQKDAAYADAAAYYATMGYDQDKLRQSYVDNALYERVKALVCKDVTVTDEDVQAKYDANIASDQELYADDAYAYEAQLSMVNYGYADREPWYHPSGYRYIKHILIPVDSTLLATYTDLQARLEEQMDSEADATAETVEPAATDATAETADPAATPEPKQVPVTQADVDNAKAAILASVESKTQEIYDKIAAGEDFDALIAQYAVKEDGTASDPGMTSGSYPNGYEVSIASASFVPEFVDAAFSVNAIGEVSAPYISDYGVHIVKYMADVPAGPIALTDELKETLRTEILTTRQDDAMTAWQAAATITYTGVLKPMAELEAAQEAADTTDEPVATEAVDVEPTAAP